MNRGNVSNLIRKMGLLQAADYIRFYILRAKNLSKNRIYKENNPTAKLPPDYLLYESFAMDYRAYCEGGRITANDLFQLFAKYKSGKNLNILDWGCGPGRIIRHLPEYFDAGCNFFGTDYNKKSIDWCTNNIPGIDFSINNLSPPLDFESQSFDIIYGISIITHLSRKMHFAWIKELHRVLNKDGVLLLTSAGNAFKSILTMEEQARYQEDDLIIRSRVKEGHRTFTAFHPAGFMRELFSGFEILEHIEEKPSGNNVPQDIWILRKNN